MPTGDQNVVYCAWCQTDLNIVTKGSTALKQHSKGAKHKQNRERMMEASETAEPVLSPRIDIDNQVTQTQTICRRLILHALTYFYLSGIVFRG